MEQPIFPVLILFLFFHQPSFDAQGALPFPFVGWARMGLPIMDFNIVEIGRPKLGETKPSSIKADVTFSLERYPETIRREWDSLRPVSFIDLLTCFLFALNSSNHLKIIYKIL